MEKSANHPQILDFMLSVVNALDFGLFPLVQCIVYFMSIFYVSEEKWNLCDHMETYKETDGRAIFGYLKTMPSFSQTQRQPTL